MCSLYSHMFLHSNESHCRYSSILNSDDLIIMRKKYSGGMLLIKK